MIKVECVSCKSPYDVDERRIPEKGMKMRCPKCNTSFMVGQDGKTSAIAGGDKKSISPPLSAAGARPAGISLPPPPSAAEAKPPAAVVPSAFKRTLLGQVPGEGHVAPPAAPAPAPAAVAPPAAATAAVAKLGGTMVGLTPKSATAASALVDLDLPAVKPQPKPAVPWGSLAPPSPDAKPAAQRPAPGGAALPKGAMGVQPQPPLAAAAAAATRSKSAGSAFGASAAVKPSVPPRAKGGAEMAFAAAPARSESSAPQPIDLSDLPAPKAPSNQNRPAPEIPLVDLPAAKPTPAGSGFGASSGGFFPGGASPPQPAKTALGIAPARPGGNKPGDSSLVDLPAAKPPAPPTPGVFTPRAAAEAKPPPTAAGASSRPPEALVDLPAAKPVPPPKFGAKSPADAPLIDLPAAKKGPLAPVFPGAHPQPAAAPDPLADLPAPKAKGPLAPVFPGVTPPKAASAEPLLDLPAPKPGAAAAGFGAKPAPELPLIDLPAPKGLDLPVAKGKPAGSAKRTMHGGFGELNVGPGPLGELNLDSPIADLPAPKGITDLPAPKGITDLPAPKGITDLPAPKGIADLPAPKGIADLPAPKGIADLPAPKGIADLPAPRGIADLPSLKNDSGFGELDLPVPKLAASSDEASFGDLELPDLPVRAGFGDIELPVPRAGADIIKPKAPTYQGVGPADMDESSFGDLDLGGAAANRNDAVNFDDIRPDDLLALKSDPHALDGPSLPPALRDGSEHVEPGYGEAGLLDDDGDENMEFGIANEAEDGFALPPEILRRQRGEAAEAADAARGKRALHLLIGVAVVLAVLGAAGAGLGFTDYGYFGMYFLERFLPEAGDPRFARETIARAEKTAVSDTYRDARRSLALLGEARHKAGLNRELLTRSLLHEALFLVRFGADPGSSAHVAAIMSRLEERHGLAPGMDLARAADAARKQAWPDAERYLSSARSEAPQDPYVGLLAGEVALRQGKLADADKAFAEALKHGGAARAQWGLTRVALGRTDDAARGAAVEQTLKLSPLHVEARLAQTRILWGQGKEEQALHALHQALGQEPIDDQYVWTSKPAKAEGYSLLGYAHEARGRLHPARKAYEEALSYDPYLVEALLGAGRVLLRERRFNDALARFESGLNLAQKSGGSTLLSGRRADVEARLGQGRAQLALSRAPDAKNSLAVLMNDNPNDAEIVLAMGQVEAALGNKVRAEELLKKAIELAPTSFAGYLALSQHYSKLNQPDKASETLNEAATKVAENVEMRRMLGQSELARNRFDSAVHEFMRAVELDPQDEDAKFGLAVAYRKTGELEKARALFDEVAARDPQYAGLTLERGQLLEAQGQFAKAVENYRAAREKDPSDSALTLRLGAAQVEAGLLEEADATLQQVMRETPNSAEAEYFTGRLALARGRGPDALTHFDRALSLDAAQAVFHLYASRAALEMGNLGRTLEEAEAALARDATLGDAYWIRGIVRMRSGAVKDALKDAKHALELAPGRYDAYALMAECHDELRQLPQAVEAYQTALAKDPQRGEWWYKLGRLSLDMGGRGQANEALGKAMALGDKQELPPFWLADAYRLAGEIARNDNRRLAVSLFKRYLAIAPDGALDREDVRKLLLSWDVDLSEN